MLGDECKLRTDAGTDCDAYIPLSVVSSVVSGSYLFPTQACNNEDWLSTSSSVLIS